MGGVTRRSLPNVGQKHRITCQRVRSQAQHTKVPLGHVQAPARIPSCGCGDANRGFELQQEYCTLYIPTFLCEPGYLLDGFNQCRLMQRGAKPCDPPLKECWNASIY